jgi:hypothetical protein
VLADLDARRVLWRSRPHRPPRLLTWSADGRRLLAVAGRRSYVFTGAGGLVRHTAAPAGTANVAAAFAGRSRDYAVVRTGRDGTSRVVLVRARGGAVGAGRRRFLFGVPGPIRGLAWSPHARWLAVVVSRADAVVLLRPGPGGLAAARSLDRAARRLGGGSAVRLEGWCCAPARPPGPG